MITIRRLSNHYRIAGSGSARAGLQRRLDHVCTSLLSDALEGPARDFADPEGPVFKIRKLKLRLWIDMQRRSDGQIAEDWARLLARALHRQLAEGGPDSVMRYPDQAAFLAAWISALLDGVAQDRWMYDEFAQINDLPVGRALVAGLARHPDHIAATFRALAGQGQRDRLIARLGAQDIAVLWTLWTGAAPRRPDTLPRSLIGSLPVDGLTAPAVEPGGSDARARTALRWLLVLSGAPAHLSPLSAAPLAMQLAQISAIFAAVPGLRRLWITPGARAEDIRAVLRATPPDLAAIAAWIAPLLARPETAATRLAVARMLPATADDTGPDASHKTPKPATATRLLTAFAGVGLLLPALRGCDPDGKLTAQDRHRLLISVFTGAQRLLAAGDFGLRQLSGLPPEILLDEMPTEMLTEMPADRLAPLHAEMLDAFRRDLRGMQAASLPYLAKQFFAQPGVILIDDTQITLRIHSLPLKVLLLVAGRLGDQGRLPWLDLALRIEVGDA